MNSSRLPPRRFTLLTSRRHRAWCRALSFGRRISLLFSLFLWFFLRARICSKYLKKLLFFRDVVAFRIFPRCFSLILGPKTGPGPQACETTWETNMKHCGNNDIFNFHQVPVGPSRDAHINITFPFSYISYMCFHISLKSNFEGLRLTMQPTMWVSQTPSDSET